MQVTTITKKKNETKGVLNQVWHLIDRNLDDIDKKNMQKNLKLKEAEILDMYDKI
jgi:hypothetical protein